MKPQWETWTITRLRGWKVRRPDGLAIKLLVHIGQDLWLSSSKTSLVSTLTGRDGNGTIQVQRDGPWLWVVV